MRMLLIGIGLTLSACAESESQPQPLWLTQEYYNWERHLTQDIPCHYQAEFIFIDEVCIEVEGVTLTAYIDEAEWSSSIWGE